MIDPITLVMAMEQSGPDKIRNSTTDIGPPRMQEAIADFGRNDVSGGIGVRRKQAFAGKITTYLVDNCPTTNIALRHRQKGAAEPVPDWNCTAILVHVRACATGSPSRAGNQVQNHERVARPGRNAGKPLENRRQVQAILIFRQAI